MSCQTGCNESFSINACNAALACEVSAEDYLNKLRTELPRGLLWDIDDERNVSKFWQSIASTFAWLHNTICSTVNETFPCATEDLLERQADLWNYPTECLGYPDTADQLCEWIALTNNECFGMNLWTLRALIDFAGITFVKDVREVQTFGDCMTPYTVDLDTGSCDGIDVCQPVSIPKLCQCAIHIELDDSFFEQDCVVQQLGECCFDVCKPISYLPKLGLDCIIAKYFAITADIYIVNSTGTTSILLEPDNVCYT